MTIWWWNCNSSQIFSSKAPASFQFSQTRRKNKFLQYLNLKMHSVQLFANQNLLEFQHLSVHYLFICKYEFGWISTFSKEKQSEKKKKKSYFCNRWWNTNFFDLWIVKCLWFNSFQIRIWMNCHFCKKWEIVKRIYINISLFNCSWNSKLVNIISDFK